MENHLKFLPGNQKRYLSEVQKKLGLKTSELAHLLKIHPRTFSDWKNENICISLSAAEALKNMSKIEFPENTNDPINRWKLMISESKRKAGIACYKKHGSPATQEGRIKAGLKTLNILREKGLIPNHPDYKFPNRYSSELAEFVGILLGDGGITKYQVSISLNGENDQNYIPFVENLGILLFDIKPKLKRRNNTKGVDLYYNGMELIKYLETIGLKKGNKVVNQVEVPTWIMENPLYKIACLRGLMDTDGGIFIHKYKINNKEYSYPKACFSNRSLPLLSFVYNTLVDLGLNPKIRSKVENKQVWLYNMEEVQAYLSVVGSSNSRLTQYKKQ